MKKKRKASSIYMYNSTRSLLENFSFSSSDNSNLDVCYRRKTNPTVLPFLCVQEAPQKDKTIEFYVDVINVFKRRKGGGESM